MGASGDVRRTRRTRACLLGRRTSAWDRARASGQRGRDDTRESSRESGLMCRARPLAEASAGQPEEPADIEAHYETDAEKAARDAVLVGTADAAEVATAACGLLAMLLSAPPELRLEISAMARGFVSQALADAAFVDCPSSVLSIGATICAMQKHGLGADVAAWMERVHGFGLRLSYAGRANAPALVIGSGLKLFRLVWPDAEANAHRTFLNLLLQTKPLFRPA